MSDKGYQPKELKKKHFSYLDALNAQAIPLNCLHSYRTSSIGEGETRFLL